MTEGAVSAWVKDAKKNAGWLIALGVLSMVVGFMAIGSPLVAGTSVSAVVGFFMLVAGLSQLVGSFKAGSFGSGGLSFLGGLLTSLAGLLMFFRPLFGLGVLAILLGIYFFADGFSGIALAFRVRPEKGVGLDAPQRSSRTPARHPHLSSVAALGGLGDRNAGGDPPPLPRLFPGRHRHGGARRPVGGAGIAEGGGSRFVAGE